MFHATSHVIVNKHIYTLIPLVVVQTNRVLSQAGDFPMLRTHLFVTPLLQHCPVFVTLFFQEYKAILDQAVTHLLLDVRPPVEVDICQLPFSLSILQLVRGGMCVCV